jgi:iron complex outermembrane receptor protein
VDATVRYATGAGEGAWAGLEFSLSAQNLFNREPPLYAPPPTAAVYRAPYDSTNYSAIGRHLVLAVSKQW